MLSAKIIKEVASRIGFDACGIAPARALNDNEFTLRSWLSNRLNGTLHYMEQNVEKRMDPRLLMEGTKTVICVALGYKPSSLIDSKIKIAQYAYWDDYHRSLKNKLYQLANALNEQSNKTLTFKACVDTVPISDKHWAARAGIGWIGRNTLLVTEHWGSWVNLGELLVNDDCDVYDSPIETKCTDCKLCTESCPNGALIEIATESGPRYTLNVERCTAYHTIENRADTIPDSIQSEGYAFGCDLCQECCPFNANTQQRPLPSSQQTLLEQLETADEQTFKQKRKSLALSRINYQQWKRNLSKSQKDVNQTK